MNKIYLDHAATTPVDPEVFRAQKPYFKNKFGNPSSAHSFGQEAMAGVDKAREQVADFLNCSASEIFFTSGATESNNLAILGTSQRAKEWGTKHIITTSIEHSAVLEVCQGLEKQGFEVTYLSPTKLGLVRVEEVEKAIRPDTFLVSIMYVNNEVGTIQPIKEIGKLLTEFKNKQKIYFHTDAVQAINYCNCDINYLGVDLLSLSGHKIYGPKGIGALYIRKVTPVRPIQYGGHQEGGLRPGTLNTAGIVGLGKAIELVKNQPKGTNDKIRKLRDKLIKRIQDKIPGAVLNGDWEKRVPANANFSFKNTEGESMMISLDLEGIAVSTGSACSGGTPKPSHVLGAMGLLVEAASESLRITLGKFNTEEEIDRFLEVMPRIVTKLRNNQEIGANRRSVNTN